MKVKIRVIPNAPQNAIVERIAEGEYKVKIQSPSVEGAANRELVKFLASIAGVSKSAVSVISGHKSRIKIVEINGREAEIQQRLDEEV